MCPSWLGEVLASGGAPVAVVVNVRSEVTAESELACSFAGASSRISAENRLLDHVPGFIDNSHDPAFPIGLLVWWLRRGGDGFLLVESARSGQQSSHNPSPTWGRAPGRGLALR